MSTDQDYFEMYGNPATRVIVPHLWLATRTPVRPTARVKFEGRRAPVLYRGVDRHSTWSGRATYSATERPQAQALMDLFDAAYDEEEGRLTMCAGTDIAGGYVMATVWVDYEEPRSEGSITNLTLSIFEVDG